jgi:hypothetical protein
VTVRRLTPDDVLLWREERLRMLSAEPANYGATYADWVDRPLSDWTESLRIISYVASMDGDHAVGAMGLWPSRHSDRRLAGAGSTRLRAGGGDDGSGCGSRK